MLFSLIGNAVAGYGLAWTARRQLAAVLLPVLAVAVLLLAALDLALGSDRTVIVNGVLLLGGDDGWWRLVVVPACWLFGLSAAALVAAGAARGRQVRAGRALVAAGRSFPVYAAGLVAIAGITGLALLPVTSAGGGWFAVALAVAVLGCAAVVAARMLVGLVAHRLGGSDWALTRGRVAGTAGAFLLGGILVPAVAAGLLPPLSPVFPALGWIAEVAGALAAAVVVAVQAGILAHVYLEQRGHDRIGEKGEAAADLAAVDARLDDWTGPRTRLLPIAVLAAAALLVPAGLAAANPTHLPSVRSHADSTTSVAAVAWPAGGHPTIATMTGARFCDNDLCDRYASVNGGPAVYDGRGAAGISADGRTVVKAMVSGGPGDGGPFVHYARCTRGGCPEAWVPVRASAREQADRPEIGAAVAPDQALWFVLAHPAGPRWRMTFLRCGEVGCERPQRYEGSSLERLTWDDGPTTTPRVLLTIDGDGRPVATVRTGTAAASLTCCDRPTTGSSFVGHPVSAWTMAGAEAVSLEPHLLRVGDRMLDLPGGAVADRSGAIAVSGTSYLVTAAEETTRPGLRVSVGATGGTAGHWQQVLWRCDAGRCAREVLDRFGAAPQSPEALAVAADGRVLIVRQDAILLVSA
ncbi:hypothetical protein [Actinoplanes sp. NPDC023714]|uniref:hypothetical protein n=1 Tax=Actinoplanes sp. NPDC023714 TaxID=3154322 RepID=UPI0033FC0B2D